MSWLLVFEAEARKITKVEKLGEFSFNLLGDKDLLSLTFCKNNRPSTPFVPQNFATDGN